MDAMRDADMADMRHEAQKLSDAARLSTGLDTMHDLDHHIRSNLNAASPTGEAAYPASSQPAPVAAEKAVPQPALDPTHGAG